MQFGLLGRKLGHSYSPQIHKCLADYPYRLFEVEPEDLHEFLKTTELTGFNVTIPYKKAVISYCSHLSPQAERIGAVNTIVRQPDGTYIGHNTDYFGFQYMVNASGLSLSGKKVLILGSGGASATAVAVLQDLGADTVVISRSGENNYSNLHLHSDAAAIVNTTPVGMYPAVGVSPIDLELFPNLEGVLDLIYNPGLTKLLLDSHKHRIVAMNGLLMLVAQAKQSAEWFIGKAIPDTVIPKIHKILQDQTQNIILIGMPGSGKTTVGKLLADKLHRTFMDTDAEITKVAGFSIPEIFAKYTEDGFRKLETEVLAQLGMQSGLVIATGGGCVTRTENYNHLHQNGCIVWLQRSIDRLPTEGRPLSQSARLEDMYAIRKPLYEAFSDITVENNSLPTIAVQEILDKMGKEI
ncbi:MAG: shikimate kinase [Oscillospiraceae bacterium]|nr:shikimate kinase [Oscillospiraceae bacterium]